MQAGYTYTFVLDGGRGSEGERYMQIVQRP